MRIVRFFEKNTSRLAIVRVTRVGGQSMVELALTLPLLFIILFGAIDLGRFSMAYVTITNASRQGARYGMANATDPSQTKIKQAAVDEAGGLINASNVVVECAISAGTYSTANCASALPGDRIRVTVNYTFNFMTLYIIGLSSLPMSDFTIMVIAK